HDPRARDGEHAVQQQAGDREVAEVVSAELHLEAVLGGRLRGEHHARVVDQQVNVVVVGAKLFGGGPNGVQRRQVELLQRDAGAGVALGDQGGGFFALVEI